MSDDTKRLVTDAEAKSYRLLYEALAERRELPEGAWDDPAIDTAVLIRDLLDTREALIKQLAVLRNVAVLNKNDPDDRQWRIELQRQLDFSRELLSTLRGES